MISSDTDGSVVLSSLRLAGCPFEFIDRVVFFYQLCRQRRRGREGKKKREDCKQSESLNPIFRYIILH